VINIKTAMVKTFCYCLLTGILISCIAETADAQPAKNFNVIAYYAGGPEQLDSFDAKKFTHIIYCFGHLKENSFFLSRRRDTLVIRKMVAMKKVNPGLKVLLSLGGWGGCKTCSDVFASASNRKVFAESVKRLSDYFKSDGIDLDWEYPTVEGFPGHTFGPYDKANFTALVKELRSTLRKSNLITFAAGGFQKYLDSAVEWKQLIRYVDFINLMTYDLVNGYSMKTGHHTSLYSSKEQIESTDNAVQYLINAGVPSDKLVIGAAFYGRMWENVPDIHNGLYQPGKFKSSINYKSFPIQLTESHGFEYHWDDTCKAPYLYNRQQKLFVTFDDKRSIGLKSRYVIDKKLNGIMFWQLPLDTRKDGLLDVIDSVKNNSRLR
jgi:chitinase